MNNETQVVIDKNNHNGIISFWKFVFSIMILIYHFNLGQSIQYKIFKYGYIGVEFFFLVSGYLMAKKAFKNTRVYGTIGEETFLYISKKIKNIFPFMLVAYTCTLILNVYWHTYTSISDIINSIWNLMFLETSGINTTLVVGQSWYISAMLISMLILYPLIRKYKKNFVYIIAPIVVIMIGGWISHNYGTVDGWKYNGIVYICLLRAFFEISLGTILYEITEKIKEINFTTIAKLAMSFIEICGYCLILLISCFYNIGGKYDFIMILMLSILIVISFSEQSIQFNLANNRICYYLEKLSLPIYLNHYWIIHLINRYLPQLNYLSKLGTIIITTMFFSVVITKIIKKIALKVKNENNLLVRQIKKDD